MRDKRISQTIAKPKALLVDDSYVTHVLIDGLLEGLPIDIIKYDRGKDAIRYYRRHGNGIVLVLLDIRWDLCKQFRVINNHVPIIAISGVMPGELRQKCEAAGFTAYVAKPFDVAGFLGTVKQFL